MDEDQITLAATISSAIGSAGNFLLFLSQVPLMFRLLKEKDSSKFSYLPSFFQLYCMSLWSAYTVWVLPTVQLYVANFSGVIIPLIYMLIFFIYEHRGWRLRLRIVLLSVLAVGSSFGLYAGMFSTNVPNAIGIGGGVTAVFTVASHASPLKQLYLSVLELDTKRFPIMLSTVQLVQSAVWIIAGGFLRDYFIVGVNSSGFFFAIVQLSAITYIHVQRRRRGIGVAVETKAVEGAATTSTTTKIDVKPSLNEEEHDAATTIPAEHV
jgi:hypothetical protein